MFKKAVFARNKILFQDLFVLSFQGKKQNIISFFHLFFPFSPPSLFSFKANLHWTQNGIHPELSGRIAVPFNGNSFAQFVMNVNSSPE